MFSWVSKSHDLRNRALEKERSEYDAKDGEAREYANDDDGYQIVAELLLQAVVVVHGENCRVRLRHSSRVCAGCGASFLKTKTNNFLS